MTMPARIEAAWLSDPELVAVFDALEGVGGTVRVNGGAVRNTLLGEPVSDIDLSTTLVPSETVAALEAAGLKAVKTGFEHGTVTAVSGGAAFEVTTLRRDVETDGRHAKVVFGTDWRDDAMRRDLTMNALYLSRDGTLYDPLGGYEDLKARMVRFIGDPAERIGEDYLRILRFFRFFARYGDGRPDAAGLKACARHKDGLGDISAERIWQEMSKLLAAPNPARALLWMRQVGVLTFILPESENWGIDEVHGFLDAELAFGWRGDPVARLMAIIPPSAERVDQLATRWRLPNVVRKRLTLWADHPVIAPDIDDDAFARHLYRHERSAVIDWLHLDIAKRRARKAEDFKSMGELARLVALTERAEGWIRPAFPIRGDDLIALGHAPGAQLGETLRNLEQRWIDAVFKLSREDLLAMVVETSG